jgi:hypothetical protein
MPERQALCFGRTEAPLLCEDLPTGSQHLLGGSIQVAVRRPGRTAVRHLGLGLWTPYALELMRGRRRYCPPARE